MIINDDVEFHVFHAACAAALAIDIQVDLCTFFNPPAPYPSLFMLTPPQEAGLCERKEQDSMRMSTDIRTIKAAIWYQTFKGNTSTSCPIGQVAAIRRRKGQLLALVRGWERWFPVEEVLIAAGAHARGQ